MCLQDQLLVSGRMHLKQTLLLECMCRGRLLMSAAWEQATWLRQASRCSLQRAALDVLNWQPAISQEVYKAVWGFSRLCTSLRVH